MRKGSYFTLPDDAAQYIFTKAKLPLPWTSIPVLIPHRLRRRIRSTRSRIRSHQSPTAAISSLQTSFSPADTLRSLKTHRWSFYDGQYLLMAVLGIFSLSIMESPGPFTRTVIATLLMMALVVPITRQFFLPCLPIFSWLVLFYAAQFIGSEYRPPIWVRVLPALENIFYGANLSNILSAHKYVLLDVLAWLPYGLTHFGAPFVCSALMFIFAPPGTVPSFAKAFGYMNLTGVIIQFFFPCSPPWYENMYGLAEANYSIPGSPAGLAAIDKLLGVDLYTSTFTVSPVVFGAFPSLHAGNATIEALFMSHVFPRLKPLFIVYALWLWWATMYLSHHYAVDLVAGSLIACIFFFCSKAKFLPRLQPGKMYRWDYEFVQVGEMAEPTADAYNLVDSDDHFRPAGLLADDEWTIGSSSSISSGPRSPYNGAVSPVDDPGDTLWEGDTLASSSDNEQSLPR